MNALKALIRPVYFWIYRLRGYPGIELFTTRLENIEHEYDDVYSYIVSKPEGLSYQAGQYTHLIAPNCHINHRDVQHMSFASSPGEEALRFTMDLSSNSPYKKKFRNARIGDTIGLYSIKGNFNFDGIDPATPIVMIAGGIGITPFRSLAMAFPERNWQLIYAGKNYAYTSLWKNLKQEQAVSYVKRDTLFTTIHHYLHPHTHYFICGTESFVMAVTNFLKEKKISECCIHIEHFNH